MITILFSCIQALLIAALAPLMIGIIRRVKARFQNRHGASIFQPYWALLSLCKKEMTITKHSSWVFKSVPFVVLGSSLALAYLVPTLGWMADGHNNVFLIAAILAIGAIFLVFGGMDVASAFGGMGSSREMTLASLVEPAIVLVFVTLGLVAHSWSLDGIFQAFTQTHWFTSEPLLLVTLAALGAVVLAENARYPVDNPATHLELTMVHEAMILEYSGPYLAMLEWAGSIKLFVLSTLFLNVLFPIGLIGPGPVGLKVILLALLSLLAKLFIAGALVATIESTVVKMRFYRMQEYMSTAFLLALGGFVLVLVSSLV